MHMRRWFSRSFAHGVLGVMLALTMVVLSTAPAVHADPRDFTLINGSADRTITHVFVSPSTSADWGDDILGRDVLGPGESVDISFQRFTPGSCMYDIKVVTADGGEGELGGVDLCSTNTVTFS